MHTQQNPARQEDRDSFLGWIFSTLDRGLIFSKKRLVLLFLEKIPPTDLFFFITWILLLGWTDDNDGILWIEISRHRSPTSYPLFLSCLFSLVLWMKCLFFSSLFFHGLHEYIYPLLDAITTFLSSLLTTTNTSGFLMFLIFRRDASDSTPDSPHSI